MSWTARPSRAQPAARLAGVLLLALLLASGLARPAWALGPFCHLVLAQELAEPAWQGQPQVMAALYAGAVAPDAGYYPGAEDALAEAAHLLRPWAVVRALLDLAQTPEERAFALGYLSHALLDRLGHESLINRLSGKPFSGDNLTHKRIEWGLDCWLLSQPANQWLLQASTQSAAGLDLWQRALARAYGAQVPLATLEQAMAAERAELKRLPTIFWLSGQSPRPGAWAGNGLGWLLGHGPRPLALRFMAWRGGYMNERAVLDARPPQPQDLADLQALLAQVADRARAARAGAQLPQGNLDADPGCASPDCPDLATARRWLLGLGSRESDLLE